MKSKLWTPRWKNVPFRYFKNFVVFRPNSIRPKSLENFAFHYWPQYIIKVQNKKSPYPIVCAVKPIFLIQTLICVVVGLEIAPIVLICMNLNYNIKFIRLNNRKKY